MYRIMLLRALSKHGSFRGFDNNCKLADKARRAALPNLPWEDDRCIVCSRDVALTSEHIIPRVLGGKLKCSFLCRDCNSRFGAQLDVQVKSDPAIKLAVHRLSAEFPSIAQGYFEGQTFNVKGDGPETQAVLKSGKLKAKAAKLADGSLIKDTSDARTQLETSLKKTGATPEQIAHHIERFDSAPDNQTIDFLPGIPPMVKWAVTSFEPDLSGTLVCPEFLLKIAYEYTALSLGEAIFNEHFDPLRRALEDCSPYNGFQF